MFLNQDLVGKVTRVSEVSYCIQVDGRPANRPQSNRLIYEKLRIRVRRILSAGNYSKARKSGERIIYQVDSAKDGFLEMLV